MNNEVENVLNNIQELGWGVEQEDENMYRLSKFSPAGQDFSIQVTGNSTDEIINNIYNVYENFDPSEETYLWLDNTGHGTNGAPYYMRDILDDMEHCADMISDLYAYLMS